MYDLFSLIPFTSSREDLNLVLRGAGYLPGLGLCHALTGGVLLDSAFHRHQQSILTLPPSHTHTERRLGDDAEVQNISTEVVLSKTMQTCLK